jgi:hypothetical protein
MRTAVELIRELARYYLASMAPVDALEFTLIGGSRPVYAVVPDGEDAEAYLRQFLVGETPFDSEFIYLSNHRYYARRAIRSVDVRRAIDFDRSPITICGGENDDD